MKMDILTKISLLRGKLSQKELPCIVVSIIEIQKIVHSMRLFILSVCNNNIDIQKVVLLAAVRDKNHRAGANWLMHEP